MNIGYLAGRKPKLTWHSLAVLGENRLGLTHVGPVNRVLNGVKIRRIHSQPQNDDKLAMRSSAELLWTLVCNYVHKYFAAARAYIYRHFNAETFATVDSRVSLICVAAGNPPPTIGWTLDDTPLTSADDDDDEGSRYVIVSSVTSDGDVISYVNVSGVRVTDGGTYRCTARNRVGVEAFSGRLNVYGMRTSCAGVVCAV